MREGVNHLNNIRATRIGRFLIVRRPLREVNIERYLTTRQVQRLVQLAVPQGFSASYPYKRIVTYKIPFALIRTTNPEAGD